MNGCISKMILFNLFGFFHIISKYNMFIICVSGLPMLEGHFSQYHVLCQLTWVKEWNYGKDFSKVLLWVGNRI